MYSRMPRTTLTLLITFLALLASACGGTTDDTAEPEQVATPPTTNDTGAATEATDYNDADIAFLQGMIPHHQGAIEMARLVPDRTDRQELTELAEEIIASQQPEIHQMEAMLAEAGADDGHGGMDDMAMGGMKSQEQMSSLEEAEGAAFDLMFIDMMIAHHQGAIDAANEVIETGSHPQVRALADEVVAAQQAEIDEMTEWRDAWADSGA